MKSSRSMSPQVSKHPSLEGKQHMLRSAITTTCPFLLHGLTVTKHHTGLVQIQENGHFTDKDNGTKV